MARKAVREWLDGVDVLIQNPAACSGVDLLQAGVVLGLILLSAHLALGALAAARLEKRATVVNDPRLTKLLQRAARATVIRELPAFYFSAPGEAVAFTAGFWKRAIYLDRALAQALPNDQLTVVLMHELTHVARYDNLRGASWNMTLLLLPAGIVSGFVLNWGFITRMYRFDVAEAMLTIVTVAAAAYVLHRTASRQLALSREIDCDAVCATATGDPALVAASLVSVIRFQSQMSERRRRTATSGVAESTLAARRIRTLLDARTRLTRRLIMASAQIAFLGALVFTLVTSASRLADLADIALILTR